MFSPFFSPQPLCVKFLLANVKLFRHSTQQKLLRRGAKRIWLQWISIFYSPSARCLPFSRFFPLHSRWALLFGVNKIWLGNIVGISPALFASKRHEIRSLRSRTMLRDLQSSNVTRLWNCKKARKVRRCQRLMNINICRCSTAQTFFFRRALSTLRPSTHYRKKRSQNKLSPPMFIILLCFPYLCALCPWDLFFWHGNSLHLAPRPTLL